MFEEFFRNRSLNRFDVQAWHQYVDGLICSIGADHIQLLAALNEESEKNIRLENKNALLQAQNARLQDLLEKVLKDNDYLRERINIDGMRCDEQFYELPPL